jgi:hypothetical protein
MTNAQPTTPLRPCREEERPNARLITAAPDLLAACKWALELHCPDADDDECGAIVALKDAIAKAEGK